MINHVRTLLRNMEPDPYAGLDGQEIVDPSYRPVVLPAALDAVRAIFFGRRPDRVGLDMRLRRYMTILHSTGLVDYVIAPDPRITYSAPIADRLEFDFRPRISAVGHYDPLYITGDPPVEDAGAADFAWTVTVSDTAADVTLTRPYPRMTTIAVTYGDGLGTPVPLVGSGFVVRFHAGLATGTAWTISCIANPPIDLGAVQAALEVAGEDVLARLFGTAPVEPYRTWRRLWDGNAPLPYRLGAALLALSYRTDECRKGR
jgi:hypothetical protein